MLGMSATELVIILALALLLLGPDQLPSVAKMLGKGLREVRKATDDLKSTFEQEMVRLADAPQTPRRIAPLPDSSASMPGPASLPDHATAQPGSDPGAARAAARSAAVPDDPGAARAAARMAAATATLPAMAQLPAPAAVAEIARLSPPEGTVARGTARPADAAASAPAPEEEPKA